MSGLRPKLRRSISGHPDPHDPDFIWLYDSFKLSQQAVRLHRDVLSILDHFDGRSNLYEIQAAWLETGLGLLPSPVLEKIVKTLDDALFLESEQYHSRLKQFLSSPNRPASCIGSYEEDPDKLCKQIDQLFTGPGGPGLSAARKSLSRNLRGALIPHIDYARGNVTYGWGFKEVIEQSDADLFVMIGTSHYSPQRYILTCKHFETPLGIVETDTDYVKRLASHYGDRAFEDEIAHYPEHSLELHAVILQHLLRQRDKDFRIVPLLVGSFQDILDTEREPEAVPEIGRMVQALRDAESESARKVCYLVSGDLAHIGPKFGDESPLDAPSCDASKRQDQLLLNHVTRGDRSGLFSHMRAEQDARRICGFPPLYTFLACTGASSGKLLHYQQYVEARGFESVSFASVAFYE